MRARYVMISLMISVVGLAYACTWKCLLVWDSVPGAINYRVYRKDVDMRMPSFGYADWKVCAETPYTELDITGTMCDCYESDPAPCQLAVKAVNAAGVESVGFSAPAFVAYSELNASPLHPYAGCENVLTVPELPQRYESCDP